MDKKDYLKFRQDLKIINHSRAWISYLLTDMVFAGSLYALWNFVFSPLKLIALIPLFSVFMFRNFSFMHEAVHGTVSKNKTLNEFCGLWSGCWSFLPYTHWKASHLEHHYWSGNVEKDPVMALRVILPKAHPAMVATLSFFWRAWLPLTGLMQQGVFWMLSMKNTIRKPSLGAVLSLLMPLAALTGLVTLAPAFALSVALPSWGLYLLLVEIVNLPHHLQMETRSGEERFGVWEQYLTARTCVYPKWFAHFVVLNFNYHSEHHMFPDAPWYELPRIHDFIKTKNLKNYKMDPYFQWTLENRPKSILQILETPPSEPLPYRKTS